MANSKPKAIPFTTPKGVFRFPKLSEVDFGTEDYPAPDGKYTVDLILQAADPDTQAFIAKLQPLQEQALAKAETAFKAMKAESRKKLGSVKVNEFYTELLDKDTEEPTGELAFRFSMKASGERKDKNGKGTGEHWDSRPTVFGPNPNAPDGRMIEGFRFRKRKDGEDIKDVHKPADTDISGGTVGKVSFEVSVDKDGVPGYFVAGTGAAGISKSLTAVQVIDLVERGQRTAADYGFGNEAEDSDPEAPVTSEQADF